MGLHAWIGFCRLSGYKITQIFWKCSSFCIGLYLSTIFCSRYRQLIIAILAIILETIRCLTIRPGHHQSPAQKKSAYGDPSVIRQGARSLEDIAHARTQPESLLWLSIFKNDNKTRWWECFQVDFRPCKFIKTWKRCWRWQSLFCPSNRYCFQQEILRLNKHRE